MNVPVTGGSGFLGTNLVNQLKKDKHAVQNLDIRNGPDCDVKYFPRIEFFMQQQDIVIHAANIPAHRLSMENPHDIILNNYQTTLNIAEAVRRSGKCNKIVFLSSFAVYNKNSGLPWTENTLISSGTPYSLCKIQCESLLYRYHDWYGIDVVIIRPSNVFGEYEELHQPLQVIPKWLDDIRYDRPLIVYGSETTRDFTYVGDVVEGIMRASKKGGFEIYNLCNNNPIKLVDIARLLSDNVKIKELPGYEASQWYGSFDKAKDELGYKPTKTIWEWIDERKKEIKSEKDTT